MSGKNELVDVPCGTTWEAMTKVVTEQGHYGGFQIRVTQEILDKIEDNSP